MKVFGFVDQDKFDNMNPVNDIIDELSNNRGSFNDQVLSFVKCPPQDYYVVLRNYFDNKFVKVFTNYQYDDALTLIARNFKTPNIVIVFDPIEDSGIDSKVDINWKLVNGDNQYIQYRIRNIDPSNYFREVQYIANQVIDKLKEFGS